MWTDPDPLKMSLCYCHVQCDQLIETGRVRQSAVIHCQIRLVYSKSSVIAYVRFARATSRSADDKGDQLI